MISLYKILATVTFLLMVTGFLMRHGNPKRHAALMGSAILGDYAIVLILEVQRQAVATAVSGALGWPQLTHIGFSTLAALLYLPVGIIGIRKLVGKAGPREFGWSEKLASEKAGAFCTD